MLKISNIDVYYGDLQALHDVTFEVKDGELVALIGSNGSGKSTLIKTVMGLIAPRSGAIEYNEVRIGGLPAYKVNDAGISMVPEDKWNFANMDVEENLLMGAYPKRCHGSTRGNLERVYHYFPRLKERRKQLSRTLSGGELQMMIIGRALMSNPKLIMVDELSIGLSPKLALESLELLSRLHQENDLTVILAEQNVFGALEIADRGVVLKNGQVALEGSGKELLASDQIRAQYLGINAESQ